VLEALRPAGFVVSGSRPEAAALSDRLEHDQTFQRGDALYEWRAWGWQRLDQDRLALHLARGELLEAVNGPRRALALLASERLAGETRVALIGGDPGPARRIIDAVTAAAGRRPIVRIPDGSPLLAGLGPEMARDGWRIGEHVLVLMARPLRDRIGRPLPLPDEGRDRLELVEPPRRLRLVPAD
jgi:hypothetical protein